MGLTERQPSAAALFIAWIVLSTVTICIRAWAVLFVKVRRVGWDDFFAFTALPFVLASNSLFLWWISIGLGRHSNELPPEALQKSHLITFIGDCVYTMGVALPKFSVLFFYNRVFEKTSRTFRITLWVLGGLNLAWIIMMILMTTLQCNPPRAAWGEEVTNKKCIPEWPLFLGRALVSVVIDLAILIAPLPRIWRLQLSTMRKLVLVCIFIAGYAVIICSVGRIVALAKLGDGLYHDTTYGLTPYVTWVASEGAVSVISVSIPIVYLFSKRIYRNGWQYAFTGERRQQTMAVGPGQFEATAYSDGTRRKTWDWHADSLTFGATSGETKATATAASTPLATLTQKSGASSESDDEAVKAQQPSSDEESVSPPVGGRDQVVRVRTDVFVYEAGEDRPEVRSSLP